MNEINLMQWHVKRELDFCPKHFVVTKTPITDDRYFWIRERLFGRFCLQKTGEGLLLFLEDHYPAFEDPQEAVLYELTFS